MTWGGWRCIWFRRRLGPQCAATVSPVALQLLHAKAWVLLALLDLVVARQAACAGQWRRMLLTWRVRVQKAVFSNAPWPLQTMYSALLRNLWFCLAAVLAIRLANLCRRAILAILNLEWRGPSAKQLALQRCAMAVTAAFLVVWIPILAIGGKQKLGT